MKRERLENIWGKLDDLFNLDGEVCRNQLNDLPALPLVLRCGISGRELSTGRHVWGDEPPISP
jgi:hypothetical protein